MLLYLYVQAGYFKGNL